MTYDILIQEARDISEDLMREVIRFIRFLKLDTTRENPEAVSSSRIRFDVFAGGLEYISDDFDSTLDTLEEYV